MKFISGLGLFLVNVTLSAIILAYGWNTFLIPHVSGLFPISPVAAYALAVSFSAVASTEQIKAAAARKAFLTESEDYYSLVSMVVKFVVLVILFVLSYFI